MSFSRLDATDFVISADSVTAPAWSTNSPVLTQFFTLAGTGTTNNTSTTPGQYITFQISAHLTRVSKLNLLPFRL
jgi:hypothetical protein